MPAHLVGQRTPYEWQTAVAAVGQSISTLSTTVAKRRFLATLSVLPTFGMAVFEAEQIALDEFPKTIWLGISQQGLSIMKPQGSTVIKTFPFKTLSHWESTPLAISFSIVEGSSTATLPCHTPDGKKIDRLLLSYCSALSARTQSGR